MRRGLGRLRNKVFFRHPDHATAGWHGGRLSQAFHLYSWRQLACFGLGNSYNYLSEQSRFFSSTENNLPERKKANIRKLLRQFVQPFVWECHPDRAKQNNLSKEAQALNLQAIQQVNSLIDGAATIQKHSRYPFDSSQSIMKIEFVLGAAEHTGMKHSKDKIKNDFAHRVVELQFPQPNLPATHAVKHIQLQLSKLLRSAGLNPKGDAMEELNEEEHVKGGDWTMEGAIYQHYGNQARPKTKFEQSRDRFYSRFDQKRFDQMYQEAWRDYQADVATKGWIRDSPKRRQSFIAQILSGIRIEDGIQPLERLVAYRRLARLFDRHFDQLQLETFGRYWEERRLSLVIKPARAYNTSSSARHKRTSRSLDIGYVFTIHSDDTATLQVPIDFYDDELVSEIDRNLWDFYNYRQQQCDGVESLFVAS